MSDPPPPRASRELASKARHATLATLARAPAGHPFASLVAVACDARGRPLLLLSSLAEHTKNLEADDRASVLVSEEGAPEPLASARVTLVGRCRRIPEPEVDDVRTCYLAAHPGAAQWAAFRDFAFYRLEPEEVRFVAGFGRMGWISGADYLG